METRPVTRMPLVAAIKRQRGKDRKRERIRKNTVNLCTGGPCAIPQVMACYWCWQEN